MKQAVVKITISVKDQGEAAVIAQSLQNIATSVDNENLKVLGKAALSPTVNSKISKARTLKLL